MKITDLTHKFTITDMVFPGTPLMNWERTHTCEKDGYNLTMMNLNSHAGTHTDAPLHFLADGKPLSEVDIERYVGTCVAVDCRKKGAPKAIIEVEDVKPYEEEIKKAKRVLLVTGWNSEFNTEHFFTEYPSVSLELAKYLVSLGVVMIGVEGPSVNIYEGAEVHVELLSHDVAIVEALTNMEGLIGKEFIFCGAPLKFNDLDGCPLRAYALEL